MPIIEDERLVLTPTEESLAPFANDVARRAKAGVEQAIPGIEWTSRLSQGDGGTGEGLPPPAEEGEWETLSFPAAPAAPAPAPAAAPEEQQGWLETMGRSLAERSAQTVAKLVVDPAKAIGDLVPDWLDSGLVIDEKGIRWASGDEYAQRSIANVTAQGADELDWGGQKNLQSTDEIKEQWKSGDKWGAAGNALQFAIEQGIVSLPDMIAVVAAMPQYTLGASADYAQQRANNDGRSEINGADALWGTATGLFVSALERYGADKVLGRIGKDKGRARQWLEGIIAEAATEAAQSPAEFAGTRVDTQKQGELTAANLGEQAGWGALGGAGGGAAIGGAVQGVGAIADRMRAPAAPDQTRGAQPPAGTATPAATPPAAGVPSTPPSQQGGAPAAAAPATNPKVGVWRPQGQAAVPVRVERVDGDQAFVTTLDDQGNPRLDEDGEPLTYPVPASELVLGSTNAAAKTSAAAPTVNQGAAPKAAPKPPASKPAVKDPTPTTPAGVPDAPTAEPPSDIKAQIADMRDPATPRQAVFLSIDNARALNKAGQLGAIKEQGVAVTNFDYGGGVMVFPDQATADAAVQARNALKNRGAKGPEMQALIGRLTGAAVVAPNKPDVPNPVVVQAKNADGAVVQETVVAPEQAQAAAAAVAGPGRAVEVTTPAAALDRRETLVAAEGAAAAPSPTKPKAAKPKPARQALNDAMSFIQEADTPPEGKKHAGSTKDRALMVQSFAEAVFAAAGSVAKDKLPPDTRVKINRLKAQAQGLDGKLEEDFQKSRGTGHEKLDDLKSQLLEVAKEIEPFLSSKLGLKARADVVEDVADQNERLAKGEKKGDNKKPAKAAGEGGNPTAADEPALSPEAPVASPKDAPAATDEDEKMRAYEARVQSERATEQAPPQPTASEPSAAPAGEKVVQRKKKVVVTGLKPTAKTAEQIAEEQRLAALESAEARPVIEVKPRRVVGNELVALIKQSGIDPELLEGSKADAIREMLPDFNQEGSWIGWLAGLKSVLAGNTNFETKFRDVINDYVEADDAGTEAARDKLIDLLQNIDGQRLPKPAIEAMVEYANYRRAFAALQNAIDPEVQAERDLIEVMGAEIKNDVGRDGFSIASSFGEQAMKAIPASVRTKLDNGWAAAWAAFTRNGLLESVLSKYYDSNTDASAHEILDKFLENMRQQGGADLDYFRTFVAQLRKRMPDVPVRFGSSIQNLGNYNRDSHDAKTVGLFDTRSNTIQVRVVFNTDNPELMLRTLLHEAVHAATVYEVYANPAGPAATQARAAWKKAYELALKKWDPQDVRDSIAYATGDRKEKPRVYIPGLYGLANEKEFVAEVFTNPAFQQRLLEIGEANPQGGVRGFVKQIVDAIVNAFYRALDLKNPAHGWLLRDAMNAGVELMDAQLRRAGAQRAATEMLVRQMQILNPELTPEQIRANLLGSRNEKNPIYTSLVYSAGPRLVASSVPAAARDVTPLQNRVVTDQSDLLMRRIKRIQAEVDKILLERRGDIRERHAKVKAMMAESDKLQEQWFELRRQEMARPLQNRAVDEDPPLRREAELRSRVGDVAVDAAKKTLGFSKSAFAGRMRDGFLSMYTFDQLERRMSRFFGSPDDPANPLRAFMDVRRRRLTAANVLLEKAENEVNSEWLKLSPEQSRQLGEAMIATTIWQIDPDLTLQDHLAKIPPLKNGGVNERARAKMTNRYEMVMAKYNKLGAQGRAVYAAARKYNEYSFNKLRRAAVDLALDGYSEKEISKAQRSILYSLRSPDDVDNIVGVGKLVDLGESNDSFARALKDVMKVTRIEGPYFTLRRYGDHVVEAKREGEQTFATEDDAKAFVADIGQMTPKNKAKIKQVDGQFVVSYKVNYVAFHRSRGDAEADAKQLAARGLEAEVTRKNQSVVSSALTPALQELMGRATRRFSGDDSSTGKAAIAQALQNAFATILAERAAIGSQLKRENVAGAKPEEMHQGFAERAHSFAWHYANLATAKAESRALARLREYGRKRELGNADDTTLRARGDTVAEVEKRIAQEADEFTNQNRIDNVIAKLSFANFLATPSYAAINAMQNFTVAIPVIGARYGYGRTTRAFKRSMGAVAGPAFANAVRGLAKKPGSVSSYDIYKAVAAAVADDPRLSRWAQGENSPVQQLVDLGVINASFTQELVAVAQDEHRLTRKTLEYLRLLPQAAEMMNRVSTTLALLELTNGNVTKTADLVRLTQIDYSLANQPRAFKMIPGGFRSIVMFKMYPQAIYNLLISSTYDAIKNTGGGRGEALKVLGGIVASHTLAGGILGGLMVEPVRMLMGALQALFGDEDEPWDPNTAVRVWAAETFGEWWGGVLAKGLPNAFGVDLSGRMGIAHLFFRQPPDLEDRASLDSWIVEQLGPGLAYVTNGITGFFKNWNRGDYWQAVSAVVPLKVLQDATKAIGLLTEGMKNSSGNVVLSAEEFNAAQATAQALGFRTREEADVRDKMQTKFKYDRWAQKRRGELIREFVGAATSGDARAKEQARKAILRYNETNPGNKIKARDIQASRRTTGQRAAEARGEGVRNPDLRERQAY